LTLPPNASPATTSPLIATVEPASDDESEEPVATTEPTAKSRFEELIATREPTPFAQALTLVATPTRPTELIQIDYASEEWDDVWLCGNEKYLQYQSLTAGMGTDVEMSVYADLTPAAYGETWPCSVFTAAVFTNLWIYAAGTPNHDFESTLGCCAAFQDRLWTIPLKPKLSNEDPVPAPERGAIAVTVTGVAIYGPEEGPGGDAVASEYGYFEEDRQPVDLGVCGGHSGPKADEWAYGGEYHYHYDSNCMHLHDEGRTNMSEYVVDVAESVISKVVEFAFDGFPIYGTYEVDSSGETIETTSSFRLKDGKDGYGGIDDYEFIEGIGTLDECNGHFGATPEVPEGIYHYHSTLKNGDGDLGFPYFPLCYKGVVNEENYVTDRGIPALEAPYGFWGLVMEPGANLLPSPIETLMCLSNCGDPFMDRQPGGFADLDGPG
tara:strand:- start:618 stop:1928 length:1311 start_codon:yes stop_codon:yes gene_type:complete